MDREPAGKLDDYGQGVMRMIWYFLAGFISGAVGLLMFMRWVFSHVNVLKEVEKNDKRTAGDQGNLDGTV